MLRGSGAFRALWGARAVSFLGDSLGLVALLLYVQASTGAAFAVALLLLAGDFVPGLFGAFAGVVGDRFDLRRVMVACDLVQGVLTVVMALILPPLTVLLVMVAVRSVTAQVFQAASRSAMPALVRDDQLEAANSALGAGTNGLEAIGPIIAAGLFLVTGVRGILLIDAATFFVSAGLLTRLPKIPPSEPTQNNVLKDARDGLGYIMKTAQIRVIRIGFFAIVVCNPPAAAGTSAGYRGERRAGARGDCLVNARALADRCDGTPCRLRHRPTSWIRPDSQSARRCLRLSLAAS
ncbi:MFS transporter [Kribbella sp. NPDC055110]